MGIKDLQEAEATRQAMDARANIDPLLIRLDKGCN